MTKKTTIIIDHQNSNNKKMALPCIHDIFPDLKLYRRTTIQIYLFIFQFEQCVGNQKTNYDNKKTLQTVHQNLRLTNNHFTTISSKVNRYNSQS